MGEFERVWDNLGKLQKVKMRKMRYPRLFILSQI